MIDVMQLDPYSKADFLALLDDLDAQSRRLAQDLGVDWHDALAPHASHHSVKTQMLVIARAGLFDAEHYLSAHPDLASLGLDALQHYVEYGDAEGRWPNPCFNPKAYRGLFADGALKGIGALYHYAVLGEALGLAAPPDFDGRRYLATYPALATWLDRPLCHFLRLGRHHGLALHHRLKLSAEQRVTVSPRPATVPMQWSEHPEINVVGPLDRVSGLGVSARGYLDGLRTAGHHRLGSLCQPLAFARQSAIDPDEFPLPPFIEGAPVNIVHMNGDTLPLMLEQPGGHALLASAHNIAVWYWELPVLRPEWHASLKYFHEFWAPTPFIADTLRAATAKPVTLLPPYLAHLHGMRNEPAQPASSAAPYFIYCFDANSILERKNPMSLVRAFQQAFPAAGEANCFELVLKVTYPDRRIQEVESLYLSAERDPRIRIIDSLLPTAELHRLIGGALAYVSPHRSEGLGLTVIEAMASGVPVITTAFSGLAHFVDDTTAWPVVFDVVELPNEYHPYPAGFVWCNPSVDDMARGMREVVTAPVTARERSARARNRVLNYFSSPQLIERYQSALKRKQQ